MRVLVVNAGSSSVKLRLLGPDDELIGSADLEPDADLEPAVERLGEADAVGHRIVHGGTRFRTPVLIDDEVVAALEQLTVLAPLHQPPALAGVAALRRARPGLPEVACFDTAFHAGLPAAAATYAVPREWREAWGVRRYGFHGLSHAWAARRAGELLGDDDARVVSCHLGAGASLAAVRSGRSLDTTMGFTPLEGLVMATRSGNVDPGMLLWLLERKRVDARAMSQALEYESGLHGLAGTADMREVLAAAARGDADARLGRDVYVHRLRAGIAAMTATLGGLDALVFTGRVGERAPAIRAAAAETFGFLAIAVHAERNNAAQHDADVTASGATARTFVIESREDREIARGVRDVVGGQA